MPFLSLFILTIREIVARKIAVGLFAIATLSWVLLTLALNLDIVDGGLAAVKLFGQPLEMKSRVEVIDEETGEVGFEIREWSTLDDGLERLVVAVETFIAGLSYWIGTFLALFATGGLIASLVETGTVDLALSKPISRARILTARLSAVGATAVFLSVYMLGMIWLVMSWKTGAWHARFLLTIPVILVMFAVLYSVMTFFSVITRNAAPAFIATFGMIFVSIILALRPQLEMQIDPPWRQFYVACYHLLPNYAEVTEIVSKLAGQDPVSNWYPLLSSAIFGLFAYLASYIWFVRRDF